MWSYNYKNTVLHSVDPLIKFLIVVVLSVLAVILNELVLMFMIFFLSFVFILLSGADIEDVTSFSKFFFILSLVIITFHSFFNPLGKTVLLNLFIFNFTIEGFLFGLLITLRLWTILFLVLMMVETTKENEFVKSISRIFPKTIVISLAITMRFIPIFQEELNRIVIAQKSRGMKFTRTGKLKAYFSIIVPLITKALVKSRYLSFSMESRGFGT